jgi:hypothetical protein
MSEDIDDLEVNSAVVDEATPPPFEAANYTFSLDSFHIDNTRSLHEDTDVVSVALKVDGQTIGPEISRVGDVNNGDHPVGLSIGPILVDRPDARIEFNFQILNSGHQDDAEMDDLLRQGADSLIAAEFSGGQFWAAAATEAISLLTGLFTVDCDGPVAIHAVALTGDKLNTLTHDDGVHTESKFFPGVDSAVGCGSNSKYTVTWSFSRS